MIVRTEVDAVLPQSADKNLQLTLNAFSEYYPIDLQTGAISPSHTDWKTKIDSQRGAIMAKEMRNNASKLARWTVEAMLANADQMKLGFVSRKSPANPQLGYLILGTQFYRPNDFAQQLSIDLRQAWGIVKSLCDLFLGRDDGLYVLIKDSTQPKMKLYQVPESGYIAGYSESSQDAPDQVE